MMDLHAGQIQGFFNIRTDELSSLDLLGSYFAEREFQGVVVAPDLGAAKRARNLADMLKAPLALSEKRRISNDDSAELLNLIGEVDGQDVLIIDDEVDTAGTLVKVADLLKRQGALDVYGAMTHGVLSGQAIEAIEASPIKELVITDTLPQPRAKQSRKISTVSVAPLLGEAISRIHDGRSVGELFDHHG